MAKRQLNLNAPLISARRYSSPLKSSKILQGQVIQIKHHPGASEWDSEGAGIPFQWEQSPGRPKDDIVTTAKGTSRLPPARAMDAFRRYRSGELPRGPPRFISGERINDHKVYKPQVEDFAFNDHAVLLEKLNESLNCDERNGSGSGHDAYSDALERLSTEELGAIENNFSGFGDHCTQTRDFMMKRFLQEAKAAVVKTQKYDVKKPVNELPKMMIKKAVSGPIASSPKHNISVNFPYDHHIADNGESEDEHELRMPVKRSGRLSWSTIPRFCVKNTLRLLNPLPALKSKKLTPSFSKAGWIANSGPLDRGGFPTAQTPKKKFYSGLLSRDMLGNENKLMPDSHYCYKPELSQLRRYRSGNLSPYRNESQGSPFRAFHREVDNSNTNKIASSRKIFNAFRLVSSKNSKDEKRSGQVMEAVEKTVYIDNSSYRKNSTENMKAAAYGFQRINDVKDRRFNFGFSDTFQASAYSDGKLNQGHDSRIADSTKKLSITPIEVRNSIPDSTKELVKSPLPPPLPNSPSESWLWKTLPSIPLEKPFPPSIQRGHIQSKQQLSKTRSLDPSWETIVKCSNIGQQHRPYSQEFAPRSTHRQRTS